MEQATTTLRHPFSGRTQLLYIAVWLFFVNGASAIALILYLPKIQWYMANYQLYNLSEANNVALTGLVWPIVLVVGTFIVGFVPQLLSLTLRLIYWSKLSKQPADQVVIQIILSTFIVAVPVYTCLLAIVDPHGWGVIAALFYAPAGILLTLFALLFALGVANSQKRKYKTALYPTLPLIALLMVLIVVAISNYANAEVKAQLDIRYQQQNAQQSR